MVKTLIFSDIHNDTRALESLMAIDAEAYFAAGDLVSWGRGLNKMGEVMKSRAKRVYVMPGNHESAQEIEAFCREFGFINFHGATAEIGGVRFAGLGYSTVTPFDTPGEYTDAEIAEHLERFVDWKPQVLICHSPPLGTALDHIKEGLHAGSRSV